MTSKTIIIVLTIILSIGLKSTYGDELQPRYKDRIDYDRVDKYALNAPSSAATSIQDLIDYLIKPNYNDWEKARVIYRWIAENISYDLEFKERVERTVRLLNLGRFEKTDPEIFGEIGSADEVLRQGKSVCGGYSSLFEALAEAAGLESKTIDGYSKGRGYQVCSEFSGPSDHAWNAVKLDGDWYLLDCTWGAGHVDQSGKYIQEFDEHYFLTPAEEFIYNHFPTEESWQLLDNPIDLAEYENMPLLKSNFFRYGIKLDSHRECLIESNGSVLVSILVPDKVTAIAELIYDYTYLPDNLTLVQKSGDTCQINALFPQNGEYILRVFAAELENTDNMYDWVMDYKVMVTNAPRAYPEFPKCYQTFYDLNVYLISPLEGTLATNHYYDFIIRVPGADTVEIKFGNATIPLEKDIYSTDTFKGRIFIPQYSRGKLEIRSPHTTKKHWYQVLLEYKLSS